MSLHMQKHLLLPDEGYSWDLLAAQLHSSVHTDIIQLHSGYIHCIILVNARTERLAYLRNISKAHCAHCKLLNILASF